MNRAERYEVLETIQEGVYATCYRARDRVLDRSVLLKVMHPRMAAEVELVRRFRREAKLQARLKHPHIVTIYDFGDDRDFYIASEFIEGQTLEALLRERGRLSPAELLPILRPVVDVLRYAHDHGVIHRDLKPANIMLPVGGGAKLTDFGLAWARDFGPLTQVGCVIGTPAYMSPEQARGRPTDSRTDVFSLGVVMYEALSGTNPFYADNHADALSRVLNLEPKPLDRLVPSLPEGIVQVTSRMLAKDRGDRPADLREVVRAFAPSVRDDPVPNNRSGLAVRVAVAAALVVAVGVTLLLSVGWNRGPQVSDGVPAVAAVFEDDALPATDSVPLPQPVSTAEVSLPVLLLPPRSDEAAGPEVSARLRLTVTPWAEVYIDGRPIGVTPLTDAIQLESGRHRITLKNPYFPDLTREVTVREGTENLVFDLNNEFAMVDIRVTPWAVLVVDGEVIDTTPIGHPIPMLPGKHTIELLHPDLGVRTETVTLDTAGSYRLTFSMVDK
jgi:serine/threonine-protein kinase